MITNIFVEPMDYHVVQEVLALRLTFLVDGGDPADFPEFLAERGVSALGQFIKVDDSLVTLAKLKHS